MKILFFGSSPYCLVLAEKLYSLGWLSEIITKPHGKIAEFAKKKNITSATVTNNEDLLSKRNELKDLKPDLAIVSDFGLIIPKIIFEIPKYKTLNIHFSLLPEFRGASPVQYTLLSGNKKTGISIIKMDEGLDTGDIVWQKKIDLASQGETLQSYTTQELYRRLFNIIAMELSAFIIKYTNGVLEPKSQDHSKATYTRILRREDGFIPWELLSMAIKGENPSEDQITKWPVFKILPAKFCILPASPAGRHFAFCIKQALLAFTPWPGLWTTILIHDSPKRLKLLKLHIENHKLTLDLVQLEGKNPVTWKQFQEGYPEILSTI